MNKPYVVITPVTIAGRYFYSRREVMKSKEPPTQALCPQSTYVVGPFRTVRGAKAMVHYGRGGNPHCMVVKQAEALGKKFARQLKKLPRYFEAA